MLWRRHFTSANCVDEPEACTLRKPFRQNQADATICCRKFLAERVSWQEILAVRSWSREAGSWSWLRGQKGPISGISSPRRPRLRSAQKPPSISVIRGSRQSSEKYFQRRLATSGELSAMVFAFRWMIALLKLLWILEEETG